MTAFDEKNKIGKAVKEKNLKDIKLAIETGTYNANTSTFLAEHFDLAFTVELSPDSNPYDGKNYRELYIDGFIMPAKHMEFNLKRLEDTMQRFYYTNKNIDKISPLYKTLYGIKAA